MAKRAQSKAFIITVSDKPRLLFRIKESKSNRDLTIIVRHAPYAELPAADGSRPKIVEQHLSIHNSYNSLTQINMITFRTLLEGERKPIEINNHFTAAMKQHSNYAPVFTQRCSNLSGEYFVHKYGDAEAISLGQYDPNRFQLLYMILVSKPDTEEFYEERRTNRKHVYFSNFRVSLIWSFLSLHSDASAMSLLLGTMKPEEINEVMDEDLRILAERLPRGFPPYTCIPQFANLRPLFKSEYIEKLLGKHGHETTETLERTRRLANIAGEFFKEGTLSGLRYRQHLRRCERELRNDPMFHNDPLFQSVFGSS